MSNALDKGRFRTIMGNFVTGVTVVTGLEDGRVPRGLTANSFSSVSLSPPLVLVSLHRKARSHDAIVESGSFGINVLSPEHEWIARRFADQEETDRFRDLGFRAERTGSPILDGALAWLDCRIWRITEAGSHSILVGEVEDCGAKDGSPLVFFRGSYERLAE